MTRVFVARHDAAAALLARPSVKLPFQNKLFPTFPEPGARRSKMPRLFLFRSFSLSLYFSVQPLPGRS